VDGTVNAYAYREQDQSLISKYALSNALLTQKERIDAAVEKNTTQDEKLAQHTEQITQLQTQVQTATTTAETAQSTATAANASAAAAQGVADSALAVGSSALAEATVATGLAGTAQSTASAAAAAAAAAGATATSAQTTATAAAAGATAAGLTAAGAAAGAGAAQSTANTAKSKAEDAQGTADWAGSIAQYSSNALSNYTTSNTASNNFFTLSNAFSNYAPSNHTHADKYVSSVSNNTIYTLSNVGIGTSNPNASLHIQGVNTSIVHAWSGGSLMNSTPLQYVLRAENFDIYSTSNQHYGGIALRSYNTTGTGIYSDPVRAKIGLAFITRNGTSSNVEAMNIDNTGQVGIGWSNPSYKLQVNGTASATTLYENATSLITKYSLSNNNSNWDYGSNTAFYGSNVAYWCSNNLVPTSIANTTYSLSNNNSNWNYGSNTAFYGSNTAYWCSNNLVPTSIANTTYSLSNNNSNWDYGSNVAFWTSNALSNYAANTDRYWTANTSNIYTNSNVGIGTSTPSYKLDVVGTGKFSSNLTLNQVWLSDKGLYLRTGADSNHGLIYNSTADGARLFGYSGGVLSANGGSNALYWKRDGKVGVGNINSNPSYPLDVSGIANATTLYENATSLITKYSLSNNNSNWDYGSNTSSWCSNLVSAAYADKYWTVNGTNVYTYSNVGIGTNSPSTKLQINTTSISGGFLVNSGSNNTTAIKATSSGAGWGSGIVLANTSASGTEFGIYSGSDGSLHFANNQIVSDFMVVNQNNLIGIGTTPSTYNVSIGGVLNVTTGYYKNGTSLDSVYALSNHTHPIPYWAVGSSSNAYGTIYTNSNLGIGTNSTSYYRLDVNGAARVSGDLEITNRSQTLYIQPGLKQSTATSGYCQYDLPSSGVHYYWDDMTCTGTITAAYKSFVIPHPLDRENKVLIHSCVEAPRADLMYSGVAHLKDGKVEVNIDTESCPNNPMTHGTFETLTRNPRVSLQNMTSFDRVKASIQGGTLTIECESLQSDDEIHWFVVAERRDEGIIKSDNAFTCEKGYLLTEKPKHMVMLDEADRPSRRKKDK
jgi:hypothetical protein